MAHQLRHLRLACSAAAASNAAASNAAAATATARSGCGASSALPSGASRLTRQRRRQAHSSAARRYGANVDAGVAGERRRLAPPTPVYNGAAVPRHSQRHHLGPPRRHVSGGKGPAADAAGGHTYAHTQQPNTSYNPAVVAAARTAAQTYLTGPKVGLDAADALALAKTAVSTSDMAAVDEALLDPRQVFELAINILRVRDTGPASHDAADDTAVTLAVPLFVLAAERGSDDAAYTYASLRLYGRGCEKDAVEAAEIYKDLARGGHGQATFNLASMYLKGTGVEISVSKAIGLFDLCGKKQIMRGYHAIGDIYLQGEDRPQDYAEAFKWFELGAGSAESCEHCNFALARMHTHGMGVEENHEVAFEYAMKAVQSKHGELPQSNALHNVACHYFSGKGVKADMELAAHYFDLAAQQGHVLAQVNVGNMYHSGHGVPVDLRKAREYYAMSAHAHADAKGLLDAVDEKIAQAEAANPPSAAEAQGASTTPPPPTGASGGGGGFMASVKKFFS